MRKQRRSLLLVALVALALLGGLCWLIFRSQAPPEPVYQGKRLSEWLSQMKFLTQTKNGGAIFVDPMYLDPSAEEAVQHIGTNAIPTLLQMLLAHDSNLKLKLVALAQKQHFIKIDFIPAEQKNRQALRAFDILGTNASNAVPVLIQIYEQGISTSSQDYTAYSLGTIGPPANAAIPALLRNLGNTNAGARPRTTAAWVLGELHAEPELVVPALMKCLKDSDRGLRVTATDGLRHFGNDAKAAVPSLIDLLKDLDSDVRDNAEQSLKAIDPEAAAKAGVK